VIESKQTIKSKGITSAVHKGNTLLGVFDAVKNFESTVTMFGNISELCVQKSAHSGDTGLAAVVLDGRDF
jgi:hypothetical protein